MESHELLVKALVEGGLDYDDAEKVLTYLVSAVYGPEPDLQVKDPEWAQDLFRTARAHLAWIRDQVA